MTSHTPGTRLLRLVRQPLAMAAGVFLLAVAVHVTALGNGFIYDDLPELDANPILEAPFSLHNIMSAEYWSGFQGRSHTGYYRPVPLLVQKIIHDLFGRGPFAYHLTVILLHGLLAALITEFLRRRCRLRLGALIAGALFAVHTANTEAVACSYGLKEVLAGLLPFSALFVYSGWTADRPWERLGRLAVASLLLAGGILSKESSLGFFVALPAWDLLRDAPARPLRSILRDSLRPAVLHGCLFAAAIFTSFTFRAPVLGRLFAAPPGSPVNNPMLELGPVSRLALGLRVAWLYLRLLLFPAWLSHDYSIGSIPIPTSLASPGVLAGLFVVLGLAALLVRAPKLLAPAGVGAVITAASYALSSNLFLTFGTLFSERFLYIPSIGLCLVLAPYIERWDGLLAARATRPGNPSGRPAIRLVPAAAAMAIALLSILTLVRSREFADEDRLALSAYKSYPGSIIIQGEMAGYYANRRDFERAERLLEEMTRVRPDLPFLTEQRATLLFAQGKREEGTALLARAAEEPEADITTFRSYAERLADAGKVPEAIRQLSRGFRESFGDYRDLARARELRGALLLHLGKTWQAIADLRLSCRIYPSVAAAWADLAKALQLAGLEEEMRSAAERALELQPTNTQMLKTLATFYTRRRDFAAAATQYRRVIEIDRADISARDSLGGCLIALGRQDEARVEFEEILRLAPTDRYALASMGSLEDARGNHTGAGEFYERFLASPQADDDLTRQVRSRLERLRASPAR